MKLSCFALVLSVVVGYQVTPCSALAAESNTPAVAPKAPAAAPEMPKEAPAVDTAADEAAIRANAEKYVEAYNRRDSKSMADMWSPEAIYMDPRTDEAVVGRDAIKEQFDYALAGQEDAKLAITIDSIEFVSPNVALEKGSAVVTYGDHPNEESTYSAVHVKRDGKWMIDRISESEVPAEAPSNYEHLKPLEWMIGSWIDSDETATVETQCEWTKNKNFMTRSFAVVSREGVELSGMQILGWDAAANQVRSWVFDSTGGFGQGTWTADGENWTIQSVGSLVDGRKTSATNLLKKIDDNSYTWESINRQADGELQPNVDSVMIVREVEDSE